MKKTGGRKRIPIQKIQNKNSRKVTFSKRRAGLFKKASEISTLCGSEIAVIVFSESGKAYSFGHPCAESVIRRYLHGSDASNSPPQTTSSTESGYSRISICAQSAFDGQRRSYESADALQWENRIGGLGLNELKLYANYLQNLRNLIAAKATSMASPSGTCYVANQKDMTDHENQNTSSDDLLVRENCFDDVNWSDIESAMVDSPTNFVGDSQLSTDEYKLFGEGMMDCSYVQSDELPSSSCLLADAQFDNPLSDIQWEDDGLDLFASFLQDQS